RVSAMSTFSDAPPRHPEKASRPDNPSPRKPPWIRVKAPGSPEYHATRRLMRELDLHTVCEEAACPNIGECWKEKHATVMILGADKGEILQVMDDLRAAGVDFLTIGQYLQPTPKHHAVARFVEPAEFESYRRQALAKGFLMVSASPLTRSSYHAGDDFAQLKA